MSEADPRDILAEFRVRDESAGSLEHWCPISRRETQGRLAFGIGGKWNCRH